MKPGVRTDPGSSSASAAFDVVSIGETMVAFVSRDDPHHYLAVPAGAESNLAVGMAQLGCRTQWVSRLGDDPLGWFIEESISASGVTVDAAHDPAHPTGVMTVHVAGSERVAAYYRSESAARSLTPDDLRRAGPARWVHVTGITPALSESAAALVEAVVEGRVVNGARVSFDVNYRPALWPDAKAAAGELLRLARSADVVFIGDDESVSLFGTSDGGTLSELILRRHDQELILKRGGGPASVMTPDVEISVPALGDEVVEPTGAGDAFAAGYLAASAFGWRLRTRLRLGHLMASRVIGVLDHVPPRFQASDLADISPASLAARWERMAAGDLPP